MNRYLANYLLLFLPISGFFRFKQLFLSQCNMVIKSSSCVNGHTWFYGRGKIMIGEHTWIGPRCRFYSEESVMISIGNNCDIAPEVAFITGTHVISDQFRRAGAGYCESIVVENGCWIGARVTILGGVTIGAGSIIGSGALVTKSIPANSMAAGVPAKVKKNLP